MFDFSLTLPPTDWARLSLVYCHLLSCAFALVLVLSADWRILSGSYSVDGLRRTAHWTTFVLALLWVTGLALVYLDTALNPAVLATKPKLLFKLAIVTMLTANGIVLHGISFPLIARKGRLSLPQAWALAVTGAFSTSHWMLAAFVGVARPLGQWPLETLMTGYALYCLATLCVATLCTTELRRRLAHPSRAISPNRKSHDSDEVDVLLLPADRPNYRHKRVGMPLSARPEHPLENLQSGCIPLEIANNKTRSRTRPPSTKKRGRYAQMD